MRARVPDASAHQRRGLVSGGGKPVEVQTERMGVPEESQDALPLHPLGRYRKRAGRRAAKVQVAS